MRFVYVPVAPEARLSPILVRPVREQLEHDRVIRLLQQDLAKKKVEVGINPGAEQNASVGGAGRKEFPDAVIYSTDKGRKLIGVVEVETAESVNHLEAMSQWAHLAKLKVPFHLYVPTGSVDVARRLSEDYGISVTEIWSYLQVGEQFKFTLIYPPARGRSAAAAPRTVSVASIRVEQRPDPTADLVPDEPAAKSALPSAASRVPAGPRVIPAKPKVVPPKGAVKTAPPKAATPERVVPAAKVPPPSKAAPSPKAAAPAKAAPASKGAAGRVTPPPKPAAVVVKAPKAAAGPALAAPKAKPSRPVAGKSQPMPRPAARAATARPAAPKARKGTPPPVRKHAPPPKATSVRAAKAKPAASRKPASKRR
jgi:hypothetical protein